MKILLDKNKNYYKANLHTHTDLSDGYSSPERIKKAYKDAGYSVVAFTDHEFLIDASTLTDDEFIAINGCELTIKESDTQSTKTNNTLRVTHLCLYAERADNVLTPCYSSKYSKKFLSERTEGKIHYDGEYERDYSPEGISELIRLCHEAGFLVAYNHPGWSLELDGRYLGYDGVDFVEIFNTGCLRMGFSDDEAVFSTMLLEGKSVYCTAADDCHSGGSPYPVGDSFVGHVMINADSLSYESVIEALKAGSFYASSGPQIHSLTLDDNTVSVECSDAKRISILYRGRFCNTTHKTTDEPLTRASFKLRENTDGFRIRVEDESGMCAWSQFYPLS